MLSASFSQGRRRKSQSGQSLQVIAISDKEKPGMRSLTNERARTYNDIREDVCLILPIE